MEDSFGKLFDVAGQGYDAAVVSPSAPAAAPVTIGSTVRSVIGELRGSGFSFMEIASLLYLIIDTVQKVGPDIAKVVEEIKALLEKLRKK